MRADDFTERFERLVAAPLAAVGFEPWGRSLWYERDGIGAALKRVELRNLWPFELSLLITHTGLRDTHDRPPGTRPKNPTDYPIAIAPSAASDLLGRRWRYRSNFGRPPSDVMIERRVDRQLTAIATEVARTVPAVSGVLTPARMVDELRRHGEDAWIERRWIEDYERLAG